MMNSNNNKILGWHFSKNVKLGYYDNRPIVVGTTFSVKGKIIPCRNGLHASEKALDAFHYVQGNYLWRVELEEDLQSHANSKGIVDKWVGRRRKVLAGGDATEMLLKFARDCALDVLRFWPDAPKEVKQFLKTGVIDEIVDNYFDYGVFAYNNYSYPNTIYAIYNVYNACKLTNDIGFVYETIYYTAKALDIPFKSYTDKFEEACLNFITEKS